MLLLFIKTYGLNEAGLVDFVYIVFKQGVKILTLSSMENLVVECNQKGL